MREARTHVFLVHARRITPHALERCRSVLSAGERAHAERFRLSRDRKLFTITRGTLRIALSRSDTTRAPEEWAFEKNSWGRPEIEGRLATQGLEFNVSHTDGLAAVVVSRRRLVGIDVECTSRQPPRIEEATFSASERVALKRARAD